MKEILCKKRAKKLIRPLSKAFFQILGDYIGKVKKERPTKVERALGQRRLNELIAQLLFHEPDSTPFCNDAHYQASLTNLERAGVAPGNELLIAQAYEDALCSQRTSGSYYTPPALARQLTTSAMAHLGGKETFRLVDPACGTGIFLLTALTEIKEYSLLKEKNRKSIELLGVEKHGPTAQLAEILVTSHSRVLELTNLVDVTIKTGDALIDFTWEEEFDAVIGNPPFLSETRGQADRFINYRDKSLVGDLYCHKMDLFYFFIGLAVTILRRGGRLALVVADYWTSRSSAEPLRNLLLQKTKLIEYVSLGDHRLFRNAIGCHSALLIAERSDEPAQTAKSQNTNVQTFQLTRYAGSGGAEAVQRGLGCVIGTSKSLSLLFADEARLLELLQQRANAKIDRNAYVQGLVAPQTRLGMPRRGKRNFDDGKGIFVLTDKELAALEFSEREMTFVRPYYWGTQVLHYFLQGPPGGNLLYIDCKRRKALKAKPEAFPAIRAHLEAYEEHITSSFAPYGLHRPRKEECFSSQRRLIGVRKGAYPRVCLVEAKDEAFVGETCFVILPQKQAEERKLLPYLLMVLNSTLAHFWFTHKKAQGRHVQLDKGPLLSLPLRLPPTKVYAAVVSSVEECLSQVRPLDLRAYDALVYALYGLDSWAIELIEESTKEGCRGSERRKLPSLDEALGQMGLSQLPATLLFSNE